MRALPHLFFERKTLTVAKDLIGKYLVRKINGEIIRDKIVETEAYVGAHDLACHSSRGKTERNKIMFEEAGTIYVYFTYGMHWMLNIVTEGEGCPTAVLIRGLESVSGPARLTKKFKIDKSLNGKKLGKKTGLWIESPSPSELKNLQISKLIRTPRIGVAYAGVWAEKLYRFMLKK